MQHQFSSSTDQILQLCIIPVQDNLFSIQIPVTVAIRSESKQNAEVHMDTNAAVLLMLCVVRLLNM